MRRFLGLLATIGLLAAIFPATIVAGEPIRTSDARTFVGCEFTSAAGYIDFSVEISHDPFAGVLIWLPGSDPAEDLPDIITAQGTPSLDGSIVRADFELLSVEEPETPDDPPTTEPAGRATLRVEVTPNGEPQVFESLDKREGNTWIRSEMIVQLLTVDGTLTLDLLDGTNSVIEVASCDASTTTLTAFGTNPSAYVLEGDHQVLSCSWVSERGFVELGAVNSTLDGIFTYVLVVQGDRIFAGLGTPSFTDGAFNGEYELSDPTSGGLGGTATADASLSRGDRIADHEWVDGIRFSLVGERLSVDGTLSITVEGSTTQLSMDDAGCEATDLQVKMTEKLGRG